MKGKNFLSQVYIKRKEREWEDEIKNLLRTFASDIKNKSEKKWIKNEWFVHVKINWVYLQSIRFSRCKSSECCLHHYNF